LGLFFVIADCILLSLSFKIIKKMGGSEIIVIVLVVLLLFGAKSIPDLARMLGKGMNEFRRASDEIKREFRENTSDITNVVDDAKKGLNKEVDAISTAVEQDTVDQDPYNLKNDVGDQSKETGQKDGDIPPESPEGPISR